MVPVRVDHAILDGLDEVPRIRDGREYRLISTRFDVPVLAVAENLPDDEKGAGGLTRCGAPSTRPSGPAS